MNRWRVEGAYGEHPLNPLMGGGTKKCTRWAAIHDGGDDFSYDCAEFDTFAEAIAYADRMARTVTVTLPRVHGRTKLTAHNDTPGGHPAGYTLIPRDKEHYSAMTIVGPWGTAGIFDAQDLEPLAIALLAYARKEKQ